mgnify:CR=1 FL=1
MRTYLLCKRLMDLVLASTLVVLFLPLFFFVAIGIKSSSKGPVFFRQQRIGYKGRQFLIFKFRTMHVNSSRPAAQTPNWGDGVFAFGGLLRRLKIDELPQVVNIISGDMSFVGPRPCLPETFKDMPRWAKKRIEMRPGLTGIAQINGNTTLSWEERWNYDIVYISTYGFWLDLFVILETLSVVVCGEKRGGIV